MENKISSKERIQNVYIVGAKSIGLYGGYESFVLNLLMKHKENKNFNNLNFF